MEQHGRETESAEHQGPDHHEVELSIVHSRNLPSTICATEFKVMLMTSQVAMAATPDDDAPDDAATAWLMPPTAAAAIAKPFRYVASNFVRSFDTRDMTARPARHQAVGEELTSNAGGDQIR